MTSAASTDVPLLELRDVVKQFGGTLAVDHLSMTLRAGRCLALLGQNGAGKSTVIKMLAGVYTPDGGDLLLSGQRLDDAARKRISFIHQDLGLIDSMTAAENIAMVRGYPRARSGLIAWRQARRAASEVLTLVGLDIHPQTLTRDLSRTEKSLLAIARALARDSELLVLDEPTASLPSADVERLVQVISDLKGQQVGIMYVSHRMDEIFRVADDIAVMRDGALVGKCEAHQTTSSELIELIVGKHPVKVNAAAPPQSASSVLELRGVSVQDVTDVGPVTLSIKAGELVGLAGLRGAGHALLGRALCGLHPISSGDALLNHRPLKIRSAREAIHSGVAFLTSNRQEESLAMSLTVTENLFINPKLRGRGTFTMRSKKGERSSAAALINTFSIRPAVTDRPVSNLSGGNQQKVVLARWLGTDASLLVLEEPTMGVDVGAKAEIYGLINQALAKGLAVIVISTDFEEVATICNRAFVFNRGQVVAELPKDQLTPAALIHYAADAPADLASQAAAGRESKGSRQCA
jgi:ribose transport system ATP-binding protein